MNLRYYVKIIDPVILTGFMRGYLPYQPFLIL